MHDIAGLVALAAIGLWIAYLVPHRLRHRQQLLESRTEDRFSDGLRVLAVAARRGREVRATDARAECRPDGPKRSGLLSPARGVPVTGRPVMTEGRGGVVERPYGTQHKISADDARRAAQLRARRAAAVARRAAAARRRSVLTTVLLVASVLAWIVVGATSLAVVAAVVPTVLLAVVLLLGRRAVVQGRAADLAWEREQRAVVRRRTQAASAPRVTGRAQRPSDSHTEALAQVTPGATAPATAPEVTADDASVPTSTAELAAEVAPELAPELAPEDAPESGAAIVRGADLAADAALSTEESRDRHAPGEEWSPVPVPRPTYTTKASAPRREPLPLVVEEAAPAVALTVDGADTAATEAPDAEATMVPPLDLDAILARRRAAGE